MPKKYLDSNVYEECLKRISFTFDNFEKIYVSFSGGKDSTVMLHMVMDEAIKRGEKVGVLFIDLEGQYKITIEHISMCYEMYRDNIEPFWCCLTIHLRNAVPSDLLGEIMRLKSGRERRAQFPCLIFDPTTIKR